jgi:hypothetical protein
MGNDNIEKSIEKSIPRILFHGTTDKYLEKFLERKVYSTYNSVHMHPDQLTAFGYGIARAKFYKCRPVMLIVDKHKLDFDVRIGAVYESERLNFSSFLIYNPSRFKKNGFPINFRKDVCVIEERLIRTSKAEIENDKNYIRTGTNHHIEIPYL